MDSIKLTSSVCMQHLQLDQLARNCVYCSNKVLAILTLVTKELTIDYTNFMAQFNKKNSV